MKRVEVEWLDAVSEGRWHGRDAAIREATRDSMLHRSVGYLVHEDIEMVLLAGSRSESGDSIADTMQIPRVAVIDMRELVSRGRR